MNGIQHKADGAIATDVIESRAYEPKVQPGYSAWPVVWRGTQGQMYLALVEKRRGVNPTWKPVPFEFYEAMSLPINYHTTFCNGAKDIVTEAIVLRSDNQGESWQEVGRSLSPVLNLFAWTNLGDGSIIRAVSDDYVSFNADVKPKLWVEVSADQGNTWKTRNVVMEGFQAYTYRLKRLSDGALVLIVPYNEGFGPGRPRASRNCKRPGIIEELTCSMFFSHDEGHTWSGPVPLFSGVVAWEPDFVELPCGDLLFVNSTVQAGKAARQFVFRQDERFIPGPVSEVSSGDVPETVTLTENGLLVGAIRNGKYTCSNNLGLTWHTIEGMPTCGYQPYIMTMRDGSLLTAWHHGADNFFGEVDQFIGIHQFQLQNNMPVMTHLAIARDRSDSSDRYVNSYTATLTADSKTLSGKTIHFAYHLQHTDDFDRSGDPMHAGTEVVVTTDKDGQARLDLGGELDAIDNIHQQYRITAWFEPDDKDTPLAAARSDVYLAYTMTMTRDELARGVVTQ